MFIYMENSSAKYDSLVVWLSFTTLTWAVSLGAAPLAVQLAVTGGFTNQSSVFQTPVVNCRAEGEFISHHNRMRRRSRVTTVHLCRRTTVSRELYPDFLFGS